MGENSMLLGKLEEVEPIYDKSDRTCRLCVRENRKGINQDQLPFPRSGHRIVMTDECLYSIGGYNPAFQRVENVTAETNYPLFKELWRYNLANRSWTLLKTSGDMPSLLASHYAVLYRNRYLLVYGGTGVPFGNPCSAEVHCCDLQTLRWSILECHGEVPTGTYGHTLTLVGDRIYKVGGTTGFEYNMLVYELNLSTRKWTLLSRINPAMQPQQQNPVWNAYWVAPPTATHRDPAPRYRHETIHYDGALYVFGGGRATVSFGFRRVAVFSLHTRTWQFRVCFPDPVHAATENLPPVAAAPNAPPVGAPVNQPFNPDDPEGEGVEQGAEQNGAAHHYVNAAGYPRARKCHAALRCGDCVWLVGGFDNERIMNDVWCIDLRTLRWRFAAEWPSARYFHAAAITPRTNTLYVFGGVRRIDNQRSAAIFRAQLAIAPLERLAWQVVSDRLAANAAYILRSRLDLQPGFELVHADPTDSLPGCSNANPSALAGANRGPVTLPSSSPQAGPFRFLGSNPPGTMRSASLHMAASDDSDSASDLSDNPVDSDDNEVDHEHELSYAMRARSAQRGRMQRSARAAFSLLRRPTARKAADAGTKPPQPTAIAPKPYSMFRHALFGLFGRASKTKGGAAKRSRRGTLRQANEMETDSDSASDADDGSNERDETTSLTDDDEQSSFRERHERILNEQRVYLESAGVPWLIADRLVDSGAPRSLRAKVERHTSSSSVSALVSLSHTNATAY